MKKLIATYRNFFTREHRRSLYVAFILLGLSLVFQYYAGVYSAHSASQYVGDLLLDNLPIVNLNFIIVEGALWAMLFTTILILVKPYYSIFTLKALAVFLVLRSVFVAITHLGFYPNQIVPGPGFFDHLYVALGMETGYFFSAHTGLPVLIALIFWHEKFWRHTYLIMAVVFGISVLLAHVHYSIDVLAAPFMAYGIFKLSEYLFQEDYALLKEHS